MMTARPLKTWQVGSTTASLLVASLIVLQGLVIGFATNLRGESGLSANSICVTKGDAQAGDPSAPAPRRAHGDPCCVFHCSGGGVPPTSSWEEALARISHAQDAWSGEETDAYSPRQTLPVGSRAPPISIL
jgi:hypothetical protein